MLPTHWNQSLPWVAVGEDGDIALDEYLEPGALPSLPSSELIPGTQAMKVSRY